MTVTSTVPRRAGRGDRENLVRLLDAAFADDPVSTWVFPDEERRRAHHPLFLGGVLDLVLEQGRVDVLEDCAAAALWLSVPDGGSEGEDGADDGPALLRAMVDPENERIELVGRLTARLHPRRAHAYLWFVAVDPARQGRGLGTALLRPALDRLDLDGTAAYLEASTPNSLGLYRRLGFTAVEPGLTLPDGPTMQPMWREPQRR